MEHEAAADIADDTILDAAHDCQDCANARLIDRQSNLLTEQAEKKYRNTCERMDGMAKLLLKAETERDAERNRVIQLLEELETERGRNRVLGFQIRTLREGEA